MTVLVGVLFWLGVIGWLAVGYRTSGPMVDAAYRAPLPSPWHDVGPLVRARLTLAACTLLGPVTWLLVKLGGHGALARLSPSYATAYRTASLAAEERQARQTEIAMLKLNASLAAQQALLGNSRQGSQAGGRVDS
jgi:hypothetical protein